tara:strand:+ start:115 stop:717 length:603 start_codon:yes stop_codon:yes gene_type:complete
MSGTQPILSVELILNRNSLVSPISFMSLKGGTLPDDREGEGFLYESLIWEKEDPTEGDFAKLLKAIMTTAVNLEEETGVRYGPNVCIMEHEGRIFVYKSFDYRCRKPKVKENQRRSHTLNLENIPDCKVFVEDTDLCVIKYPFLEGRHHASKVSQMIEVLAQLKGKFLCILSCVVFHLFCRITYQEYLCWRYSSKQHYLR